MDGGTQCLKSSVALFPRDSGQEQVWQSSGSRTWKQDKKGWGYSRTGLSVHWVTDLIRKTEEQGVKYRAQSCLGLGGLSDWIYCVSGQWEHLQQSKVLFAASHLGQEWLHLEARNLFQYSFCPLGLGV